MHQNHVSVATADMIPPIDGAAESEMARGQRPLRGRPEFEVVQVINADGTTRNVEYVSITIPGDPGSSPRHKVTDKIRSLYAREYALFRQGAEMTASGTPVEMLPFIKPHIARALKAANIYTAEDLSSVADANLHRIPMGRDLQKKVRIFLQNKAAMDVGAAQDSEKEALREGLQMMEEANARMQAQIDALMATRMVSDPDTEAASPAKPIIAAQADEPVTEAYPTPASLIANEPDMKFMSFKAAARQFLGDDTPSTKEDILTALRAL